MNECFVNLMNDLSETLRQLDNVPTLVASLSKRKEPEDLFLKVLAASASVRVAKEDLYLLEGTAEVCAQAFSRSHTRTRIDGRILPYFERLRRARTMASLKRSV